ncbi:MAG: ADP-ribosylglycohydrolase family protein [Erysipelotrichaceae bacterium]|nr:ADP-ribosylglycohydrolase family protein [Erysipelotrichaceae bacterium]
MNSGKREMQWLKKAYPIKHNEIMENNWMSYVDSGKASDEKILKAWVSKVPGSLAPVHLIVSTIQAMRNKGYDVKEAELLIDDGLKAIESKNFGELQIITSKIYKALNDAKKDNLSDYWNYEVFSCWEDIEKSVKFPDKEKVNFEEISLEERIKAAWYAKLIGGAIGTQLEGYLTENIQEVFGIVDYYLREPETYNDDITYEIAFLDAYHKYGKNITSNEVAFSWLELIMEGYSAEEVALSNLRRGIYPPYSGTNQNYFSDWIGAQMRTSIHGMLSPGNPKEAARLAVIDSLVSHFNNGMIGGMFNAILLSLAFVEKDMKKLVLKVVDLLPKKSEYYKYAMQGVNSVLNSDSWQEAWDKNSSIMEEYSWMHSYPNVIAEIIALWYGDNDFNKTASIISTIGLDSDCNAAPVLSTLAVAYGMDIIDKKWLEPFDGTIKTVMRRYREVHIDYLIKMTVESIIENS